MTEIIESYKNKNIVITGASGYIASVLVDILKEMCANIIRVSRCDIPFISGTESLKADISSKCCWSEIIDRADIVFHLSGNTSVYSAAKDPVASLNSTVLPITHLINVAQETGSKPRVIFASTATVYGLTDKLPVAEDVVPTAITNYDLHKLFAEKQLEIASKKGILDSVSLRLANVYGPSSSSSSVDDRGILNKIVKMALQGVNLQLYGNGEYLRDYVYIDDVVRAFMLAGMVDKMCGRSFNVASGKGITVSDAFHAVVRQVSKVTGNTVEIERVPWPECADPIEYRNFIADVNSIYKASGWLPEVALEDGINNLINRIN